MGVLRKTFLVGALALGAIAMKDSSKKSRRAKSLRTRTHPLVHPDLLQKPRNPKWLQKPMVPPQPSDKLSQKAWKSFQDHDVRARQHNRGFVGHQHRNNIVRHQDPKPIAYRQKCPVRTPDESRKA